jgi:hypothetical protein
MTCAQIDEFLDDPVSSRAAALPRWIDEHCRRCERCRRVLELLRSNRPPTPVSGRLQSQLEETVLRTLKPVSSLPPARTFVLLFLSIFALVTVAEISLMGAPATRALSAWRFLGIAAILGAGAVLLSISLSRQMTPGSYHRIRPGSLTVVLAGACLLAYGGLFPWAMDSRFLANGFRCVSAGLALAIPPGVCVWVLMRRGAILSAGLAGATAGLFAGLLGALVLHFGCLLLQAPHVVLWHGAVPVGSAALGFLLGRLAGWRNRIVRHESRDD